MVEIGGWETGREIRETCDEIKLGGQEDGWKVRTRRSAQKRSQKEL
jgi:hypothetical protein